MKKWKTVDYIYVGFVLCGFAIVIGMMSLTGLAARATQSPQVAPISDDCAYRSTVNNQFRTEIYNDGSEVVYRFSDLLLDEVLEQRAATPEETAQYDRQCTPTDSALDNLQAGNQGQQYETWVSNRTVELQGCEQDMVTGQTFDFASLGAGGQNQTVARMQECIELNSRVNRITIQNLYDILVAEGIIE